MTSPIVYLSLDKRIRPEMKFAIVSFIASPRPSPSAPEKSSSGKPATMRLTISPIPKHAHERHARVQNHHFLMLIAHPLLNSAAHQTGNYLGNHKENKRQHQRKSALDQQIRKSLLRIAGSLGSGALRVSRRNEHSDYSNKNP